MAREDLTPGPVRIHSGSAEAMLETAASIRTANP